MKKINVITNSTLCKKPFTAYDNEISLPIDVCMWGWGDSENSHFLGKSLNHILLPHVPHRVQLHRFSNVQCQKKKKLILLIR